MGLRIIELLMEMGVSIAELGRRTNISRSSMHATLEKGNPQYSTLVNIANALNVPITELFESPNTKETIGIIRHNGKNYEINSIEDIKDLILKIKE